jgi:iron complex outermembrane receptor protein
VRLARILFLLLLLSLGGLRPAAALAEPIDFNLPAQPAADALLAFSKQAGVEVLFSYDRLAKVTSPAVAGRFEPDEALVRLLEDTGFTARRNGRGKFTVTPVLHPAGTITGRLLAPEGTPAQGVQVSLPALKKSTRTGAHGDFTFHLVPPGTYRLLAGAATYRTIEITGARVDALRVLTLETQTLQPAGDPTRLDPYIVHDKSGRDEAFDHSRTPLMPQTATGNLDLSRTENDAVPFTIFDRRQIARSGVVNLNEFLQREVLEGNASIRTPEQDGGAESFIAGSTNLDLRGYGSDETVVLVNGRRLPEVLTSAGASALPPDVSLIPISLVEQIEVLPVSASALYTGNPVGGVINIVLRPDVDVTEVTTTYTNALAHYDAPQSSVSFQHGKTLLDGALRVRLSATRTQTMPATEAELGYLHASDHPNVALDAPIYRATPNVRSLDRTPLFGPGTSSVTSVAPGAGGTGGLAAFAPRQGLRNSAFFDSPGGLAPSLDSTDYPYGRRQGRDAYFLSGAYDFAPWLQLGLDGTYARTTVNRGYDVFRGDLTLAAANPLNPFPQDVGVSLNEIAPLLGTDYSEARLEFYSLVGGLLFKLPSDWRISIDGQYARNVTRYRGIAGADPVRWQQLVDEGVYNPLRDTQRHGPPQAFYDRVLIYRGGRNRYVTLGDYDTEDAAIRVSNRSLSLPTGSGVVNVGGDYRRTHLANYTDERRYADGTLASTPVPWLGRILERVSVFGELQGPLLPAARLPRWLEALEADLAVRYISAASARETNVAPTYGLKVGFAGGFSLRGSLTTSNRVPTPQMSRPVAQLGGTPGVNLSRISDPVRQERYDVQTDEAPGPNLRPEAALTQTAGAIFQRGQAHRFRAALDFVDTRKTNEVEGLDAQGVVNLEPVFPTRVIRAPLPAGDPHAAGLITSLVTGAVNVASRHSQNWNLSLDYRWTECLGGTLEVYSRLVYFQRYDRQIFPTSPVVDELRAPDVTAAGLLKYRANFGASWAHRDFGFGVDGHYFHSRILPASEWAFQGSDHVDSHLQYDTYLQGDLGRWLPGKESRLGLRGQFRVNNVFGTAFPSYTGGSSVGVQPYGDWRGRTYSLSLTVTF